MPNFNSKRLRRQMARLGKPRRTLKERIFPKTNFWWNSSWNGIMGPGSHTSYQFRNGSLALVIAIIFAGILMLYMILDILNVI